MEYGGFADEEVCYGCPHITLWPQNPCPFTDRDIPARPGKQGDRVTRIGVDIFRYEILYGSDVMFLSQGPVFSSQSVEGSHRVCFSSSYLLDVKCIIRY